MSAGFDNRSGPQPMPAHMTEEAMIAMKVSEGEWRLSGSFACRCCGKPAYLHPHTNAIWGCKQCGFTTFLISSFFEPVPITIPPAASD